MTSSLEEEREHLLRSLEDLERERAAGDIDEADYLALNEDYTARAAEVLRALEGQQAEAAEAGEAGEEDGQRVVQASRPAGRRTSTALVVGALVAFSVVAGVLVARTAGERTPGLAATGSVTPAGELSGVAGDLAEAQQLIGEGKTLDAIKVYDRVLAVDPEQPEALAYRGWLVRLAGRAANNTELIDKGMEYIERAVAADPSYPDARFFRAFVLYQDRHDPAAAVPDLRAYLAGDPPPDMVPVVEDLLTRALAEAEGAETTVP